MMSEISSLLSARQEQVATAVQVKVLKLQQQSQNQIVDLLQQVLSVPVGAPEAGKGEQFDGQA